MELYEFLAKLREEEEDSPLPDSIRDDHETALGEIHPTLSGGSEDPRLFSNGKPTFATLADPPHIRAYAWCLVHLGFGPSLPLDLGKLASDCKIGIHGAKQALAQLVLEGDLKVKRDSWGGEIYFLAPIKW